MTTTAVTTCFTRAIENGHELLDAARLIGDVDDLEMWRLRRAEWDIETVAALHVVGDAGLARRLRVGRSGEREPRVSAVISRATGELRDALELLSILERELDFRAASRGQPVES